MSIEKQQAKVSKKRGRRALERQLDYQEKKAVEVKGDEQEMFIRILKRSTALRRRLNEIREIRSTDKILEVGSGAHGLIFGFEDNFALGIDPLAVDYKRLFPFWQEGTNTVAAIGERMPFTDNSFEIILSDNVIDHAEDPIGIIEEFARILKPNGLLYFTVNVHHPIYQFASNLHGIWNNLGIKFEISPFADHTIHFTEERILEVFKGLPFEIIEQSSNVESLRKSPPANLKGLEGRIKKTFFKNGLIEIIATRK